MTNYIFQKYLLKLNDLYKKNKRKVLFLIDNANCHKVNNLSNISIFYFPKNKTSVLQPLDQVIIHFFKSYYKKALIMKYITYNKNKLNPTPLNILEALFLVKKA